MTDAIAQHARYRGKVQTMAKCPVAGLADFAVWYTPGVAEACSAIAADPARVFELTNRANTVAVVSDGSRVLGLGNIGPEAGLPVMEGKALLFKHLGGVDAVPLCIAAASAEEIVRFVRAIEPSFGGINLEDIEQPKCFAVLDALRGTLSVPVWHDDQQGTATVVTAALLNALKVVGKRLESLRIAMVGMGAANVAVYRMLLSLGVRPAQVVACDSTGILHPGRRDIEAARGDYADKWRICLDSNPDRRAGGIGEALCGADLCIAFSRPGPGTIRPEWVAGMAPQAVVFACANPTPEIWPDEARAAGARIVATGRGGLPNQLNNSLCFPAIFRGALDVRARTISDGMALAAAREIAAFAAGRGLGEEAILPTMADWEVYVRTAVATAMAAQAEGIAQLSRSREAVEEGARRIILRARRSAELLARGGLLEG